MNKLNDEVVSFKAAISTSELEKQTNEPQFQLHFKNQKPARFKGKNNIEEVADWIKIKAGLPGSASQVRSHIEVLEIVKRTPHLVLFIGSLFQTYDSSNTNKKVTPDFLAFIEAQKLLVGQDDLLFKFLNFNLYPNRELNNLQLHGIWPDHNSVIIYRRNNLRDRKVFMQPEFDAKTLAEWILTNRAIGPGPDIIKPLSQNEFYYVF